MFLLFFLLRKLNTFNIILFFLVIILGILLFGDSPFLYSYGEEIFVKSKPTPSPTVVPTATPTPTPTPVPNPTMLIIPKLMIQAPIEYVGIDAQGKMGVPVVDSHVAWFNPGYKPGENGNAVIVGHYDTYNGAPSIFFNLKQLASGDEIFVVDELGGQRKFVVRERVEYDVDSVPLDSIFGPATSPGLNLITCSGWFNHTIQTYSQRTVVYAEMVE